MADSMEVKIARLEENVKAISTTVGTIDTKMDDLAKAMTIFSSSAADKFATKVELLEVKKNITRNLVGTNLLTAIITALFIYLLNHYLVTR